MHRMFYIRLGNDMLERANNEVVRPLFRFELPMEGLDSCADRLERILGDAGDIELSAAVDETVRQEFPGEADATGKERRAYVEALRAAIWYRYFSGKDFAEAQDGAAVPRPFPEKCSLIKEPTSQPRWKPAQFQLHFLADP
jgi:hypothetical protein